MKNLTVALAAALWCATLPADAQTVVETPRDQPYTQAATGMMFPVHVGEFGRGSIRRYAADGSDESAGYGRIREGAEIIATVYVYPSPAIAGNGSKPGAIAAERAEQCAAQFDAVRQEVEGAYTDEALVTSREVEIENDGGVYPGFTATYALTVDDFRGRQREPLRSEAYLFCYVGGRWSVKYRFSYPAAHDARGAIDAFIAELRWTIPAERR